MRIKRLLYFIVCNSVLDRLEIPSRSTETGMNPLSSLVPVLHMFAHSLPIAIRTAL